MKRRDFIISTGVAGAGMLIPGALGALASTAAEGPADLAVATGSDPAKITRAAVEALGGMDLFVNKGESVVVKPNMAWDRTPEYAANSNPLVVAEVVRMCLEAGAAQVRVFDRTVNDPRRCYEQSGIRAAAEAAGASVVHIDRRRFKKVQIPGGTVLKTWEFYSEALEADALINVPIAKHHGLAKLTMGMKNLMGVIGNRRSVIHQKLDSALVDISRVIRPRLTVLDAVRILTANGPQGGSLDDVKRLDTVVAGADQVSVDSLGATLFGMKGSDLGYVREAEAAGLGTADLSRLNIVRVKA
ncbi:MAG: DUF362 domain-containing protein [Thermodesulfovibrionales bacterium]|nr:DUF362 domain-containing protein [Thermodesulfovibrionales bacterium]